jgi:hypothetical protein
MNIYIVVILFVLLLPLALAARSLAPWVPAWNKDLKRVAKLADMKEGEVFYELGSGDGRVCRYISRNCNVRSVGIELALTLVVYCWIHKAICRDKNLTYRCANLFKTDLSEADVVYLFALPRSIEKLKHKLQKELKPGSRVISYTFPIHNWEPTEIDKPEKDAMAIYLYKL